MIGYKVKKIKYTDRKYEGTKKISSNFTEKDWKKRMIRLIDIGN